MANGFFSKFSPEMLAGISQGLLSGRTASEQFGGAVGNAAAIQKDARQRNRTLELLQGASPELAQAVESGILTPGDAFSHFLKQRQTEQEAQRKAQLPDYMSVGKRLFNKATGEWIDPPGGDLAADDAEYGLNPQYGVDADGNPVILQLSKGGTSKKTPLPEGVTLSKEPIRLDAGTHFVLLDPITRQPIGQIPKNLAEAEAQKEIGTAQGKAIAAAPGDLQAGQNAKDLIRDIRDDPNRQRGTGLSSVLNSIPGTAGFDFQTKVDQAKSGAFMTAIQQMRGLGQLSNAEGQTATSAVTRMNTATSEEAFLEALDDYERIIDQGIARAQSKMQQRTDRLRFNPATGELE